MARCLRSWPAFMPSGVCVAGRSRSCARTRTRRPNACCNPSGSTSDCSASNSRPWTVNRSISFIPVFAAWRAGRISAARSCKSATGRRSAGDMEVDLRSSGWHAHGHDRNPAFQNVILHVVWESERPATGAPPTLLLRQALDAPLGELSLWLGGEAAQTLPEELRGQVLRPVARRAAGAVARACSTRRRRCDCRARRRSSRPAPGKSAGSSRSGKDSSAPWVTSTTSGPCSASPNCARAGRHPGPSRSPCRRACSASAACCRSELTRSQAGDDHYIRRVWDQWWRERDEFSDCILPRALWRLHGSRPANHPQRRLALASRWSVAGDLAAKLEQWCAREVPDSALAEFAAGSAAGRAGRLSGPGIAHSARPGSKRPSRSWAPRG